ncbi:MAG: hypothetical protein KDH96_00580 [Candidatus Riesia sp.]|nr:hypothetical protein [Candidatus Riesia sp.]
MTKLASIRNVTSIDPIKDADKIEQVWIDGWSVVCKKGEFKVGDLGLYMEVDTVIPLSHSVFEFLKDRGTRNINNKLCHRLKSIKLRGTLSQGLLLPLSYFKDIDFNVEDKFEKDFGEYFGLFRYDPDIHGPGIKALPAQAAGSFPVYIPRTDQERLQNNLKVLQSEESFEVSIKLEGSSLTVYRNINDEKFPTGICSRNLKLKYPEWEEIKSSLLEQNPEICINDMINNQALHMFCMYKEGKLQNHFLQVGAQYLTTIVNYCDKYNRNLAFQFECVGPNIQGNIEGFNDYRGYLFDIFDIDKQVYLLPEERRKIAQELNILHVPIIDKQMVIKGKNLAEMLSLADGPSINAKLREGIVFKSNSYIGNCITSFKIVSNQYLLNQKN